jgi:hypothetical protein
MHLPRQIKLVCLLCLLLILAIPSLAKAPKTRRIPMGTWGGEHIRLGVGKRSATIDYDCAHGTINAPLNLNTQGKISLRGTHVREHGGPTRENETVNARPATYTGWTDGKTMTLTVTLAETKEEIGTFKLTRGQPGRVWKCK